MLQSLHLQHPTRTDGGKGNPIFAADLRQLADAWEPQAYGPHYADLLAQCRQRTWRVPRNGTQDANARETYHELREGHRPVSMDVRACLLVVHIVCCVTDVPGPHSTHARSGFIVKARTQAMCTMSPAPRTSQAAHARGRVGRV
jgi:hypothetical protein